MDKILEKIKKIVDLEQMTAKVGHFKRTLFLVFIDKKNLGRDMAVVSFAIIFILILSFGDNLFSYVMEKRSEKFLEETEKQQAFFSEEQVYEEVRSIQEAIDRSGWKNHQSQWYGIEIGYPQDWKVPVNQGASRDAKWEYRYQFRKKEIGESSPYIGFDLVVYNIAKNKSIFETAEFPQTRELEMKNLEECQNIQGHLIETGDYPAEEIYIPLEDDCYYPTLFFSYTKGDYIYNLAPVIKEGFSDEGDPRVEIVDNFPEFFGVAATLKVIDIVRPKPKAAKVVRPSAPRPVSFKKVNGRLVCAKASDNPGKSKQNKGKHLDMECCLDPDEYPNPNCYYDPKKYGKYL